MGKHSHFHDHAHAAEFDRRAAVSDIRRRLAERLIEAMELRGAETVLDVATGTGRFARPVSRHVTDGGIVGIDEALAMLRVSQQSDTDPIPRYGRIAATAERLPLRALLNDPTAYEVVETSQPAEAPRGGELVAISGPMFAPWTQ